MKNRPNIIAVFDIGKTNKKRLLFDENYEVVGEESTSFPEQVDEQGFSCEDIDLLSSWILQHVQKLETSKQFNLKAINFSTYGASLLYLNQQGKRIAPLYNYLKPYDENLLRQFYDHHGPKDKISVETSSPAMGHLNSGLQLYWFKQQPQFSSLHTVLHFPQYLSFQLTGERYAEMTNVGCHSLLWNFSTRQYHSWLHQEGLSRYLLPVIHGNHSIRRMKADNSEMEVGIGLHDSSAAIVPYLLSFSEPFAILSTGTWTISLNPFNSTLPQLQELDKGSLCYQTFDGKPVKVSMLFAGHDHDQQVKRIADYFGMNVDYFRSLPYNSQWEQAIRDDQILHEIIKNYHPDSPTDPSVFHLRELHSFKSPDHAYHHLMTDLIYRQVKATRSVTDNSEVKRLYVDGGFSKNAIYMQMLSNAFPDMNVFSTEMVQGTALGAALVIHDKWNNQPIPKELIKLKHWKPAR